MSNEAKRDTGLRKRGSQEKGGPDGDLSKTGNMK